MKRYSIVGLREGENRESEVAQCETNPEAVLAAAQSQTIPYYAEGGGRRYIPKYRQLRIVDNQPEPPEGNADPPWAA